MHEEIQKLIDIAGEGGVITDKQKEIILRKAEKLGEDVDEVEMVLETMTIQTSKKESSSHIKLRKCSHCGAVVPAGVLKCPECGIVMESEAESIAQTRESFDEFEKKLKKIKNDYSGDNKRVPAIGSFTVPMTKGAQMMAFNYARSRAEAFSNRERNYSENDEYLAWLSKAKEFYNNLASMATDDAETQNWLKANEDFVNRKGRQVLLPLGVILEILSVLVAFGAFYFEFVYIESTFWKIIAIWATLGLSLGMWFGIAESFRKDI